MPEPARQEQRERHHQRPQRQTRDLDVDRQEHGAPVLAGHALSRIAVRNGQGQDAKQVILEQIQADAAAGGITVAVYVPTTTASGKPVKQASEFMRQATQYAEDHHAIGLSGNTIRSGVAMTLTRDLADLLQEVTDQIGQIHAERSNGSDSQSVQVPVQRLAIFTHGETDQLQAGAKGQWIKRDLAKWVDAIAPFLSARPQVLLYACSTSGSPPNGVPFAEAMREELQSELETRYGTSAGVAPEVWGHATSGHTTANRTLIGFGGGTGAQSTHLLDELSERFVLLALSEAGLANRVSEDQLKPVTKIARRMMPTILETRTGQRDPTNVYFREVPLLGIDVLWSHLSSSNRPDLSILGMTPEATERALEGLRIFQARFQEQLPILVDQLRRR